MSQLAVDECWKKNAGRIEEEVLNKYKVKTAKEEYTEAKVCLWSGDEYEEKKHRTRKWVKNVGQRSSLGSESTICSAYNPCRKARLRRKI